MLDELRNAIPVLSLIVAALIPATVVATLQSQIAWYHGLGLFYLTLGLAEIAYLGFLVVLNRADRSPPYRGAFP